MGDDFKPFTIYSVEVIPWYKKLWYYLTFREDKIPKPQKIGEFSIKGLNEFIGDMEEEIEKNKKKG